MNDSRLDDLKHWNAERKIEFIRPMFGRIANHYDLLNHLLSGGQDYLWRRRTVGQIPENAQLILDAACGTGDLALLELKKHSRAKVIGLDFTPEMIAAARKKIKPKDKDKLLLLEGNVSNLPFANQTFDAVTIAFALRNIPDRLGALQEMVRVIKSGGKLLVLEMTFPHSLRLRKFFNWYLNQVIPFIGGILSGDRTAYRYLPASIQAFLSPEDLCNLMQAAGLLSPRATSLSGGICWLFEGYKV